MKRIFLVLFITIFISVGCISFLCINGNLFHGDDIIIENPENDDAEYSPVFENPGVLIMNIKKITNCIPVILYLYEDNNYELMIEYKSCKPGDICTMDFRYVNSIKGEYSYDLNNITDNLREYTDEIKQEDIEYIIEKDNLNYVLLKTDNLTNIEKLLNSIEVDLDKCATPTYNY